MDLMQKLENLKKSKYQFPLLYGGSSYSDGFDAENVIEAIKKFNSCYNSTISFIYDKANDEYYFSKMNNKPDVRGNYNYSFFNVTTRELLYNEDEQTAPIVKLEPCKFNSNSDNGLIDLKGNFYKCGFECHDSLAKELFLSKTIELEANEEDETYAYGGYDTILQNRGWVKISSYRIFHYAKSLDVTKMQKNAIEDYMLTIGKPTYQFNGIRRTIAEIIERL